MRGTLEAPGRAATRVGEGDGDLAVASGRGREDGRILPEANGGDVLARADSDAVGAARAAGSRGGDGIKYNARRLAGLDSVITGFHRSDVSVNRDSRGSYGKTDEKEGED